MKLPTLEEWKAWRETLPPVPDIRTWRGPTKKNMKNALAELQGYLCALCITAGKFLVLDHDHETGLARGMLCRGCNMREGASGSFLMISSSFPESLLAAYRAKPPAWGSGWIWDMDGTVGQAARDKARAEGGWRAPVYVFAPPDVLSTVYAEAA